MNEQQKDLSGFEFSLEGGRAMWYYIHSLLINSYNISCKEWPTPWPNKDIFVAADFKNHAVKWYFVISGMKIFNDFLDEILKDPQFLQKIHDYIKTQKEKGLAQLKNIDFTRLTNEELHKVLKTYFDHMQYLFIVASNVRRVDRALLAVIRTKYKDRADEVLRTISMLTQPSFALEEELALLNLGAKIEKGSIADTDVNLELKKIHDSYTWSVLGYYDEKQKGMEYYTNKLAEMRSQGAEKTLTEVEKKIAHDTGERAI